MRTHKTEILKLNNGAEGVLIHVPASSVMSYEFNFRAGEFLLDKPKWETAHLMEHLILGANARFPDGRSFNAELHKNGAYTNAFTGYYSIGYVGEVAEFEWQRVLKLQMLALEKPLFLRKEFKAEWGNIHDELISYTNNHFRQLGIRMGQDFGFNFPTDAERAELMKGVTVDDLKKHYQKTHTTDNLRFVIAGNLHGKKTKLVNLLESVRLERGLYYEPRKEKAKKPARPTFVENKTVPNIYLIVNTYANLEIDRPLEDALRLVRIMLTETLHSRIFGAAREKGLVYSVHSGDSRAKGHSEWWLSAQVLPANAEALADIIFSEIERIKKGRIAEADIAAAKQYALGSFQRSMQTVGSIAGAYNRYFFDGTIEDANKIPKRIRAVTKADMTEAVNLMFSQHLGNVGVLGGTDPAIAKILGARLSPLWS